MTDLDIARAAKLLPIQEIARAAGIPEDALEPYGRYKAKVNPALLEGGRCGGRLVLVTAISPTPAGEGKTTVSTGLADGLSRIGEKTMLALREPSLGPVFGVKGGAAGGGYAQVVPMEDINLHFTGDLHAITAANNLLSALIDNHLHQGNALGIDARSVTFKRCMDINDRALRQTLIGLGGKSGGVPREDGFTITAASEVMAAFCLSSNLQDLTARLSRVVVAQSFGGKPVTAGDLNAQGAMTALLKTALMPNLVQTLEHTPVLIHGGPFANIAHGCNSLIATRTALSLADYVVTEAGFGADLGAEKFLDIKCRAGGLAPRCAVIVATVRALKSHGGVKKENLSAENLSALKKGMPNLRRHIENLTSVFAIPVAVAVNRFSSDTDAELSLVTAACAEMGVRALVCDVWAKGGEGAVDLAREVKRLCEGEPRSIAYTYPLDMTYEDKIRAIATRIYRASDVVFAPGTKTALKHFADTGYAGLPVCIAKTQYSFSDDPKKLCAPENHTLTVREVRLSAGAGFVVVITGEIMTMPGLPEKPAAETIGIGADGEIEGLF